MRVHATPIALGTVGTHDTDVGPEVNLFLAIIKRAWKDATYRPGRGITWISVSEEDRQSAIEFLDELQRLASGLPVPEPVTTRRELIAQRRRMRADGLTCKAIAMLTDGTESTVWRQVRDVDVAHDD